jgi:hypothetical protein
MNRPRFFALAFLALLSAWMAHPAAAATKMLGAAGTTATGYSTCAEVPTPVRAPCRTGGWFDVQGATSTYVHVWKVAGTATSTTVKLWGRFDSTDTPYLLKQWDNPAAGEIPVYVEGCGEVRLEVSAIDGGVTVDARIIASTGRALLW